MEGNVKCLVCISRERWRGRIPSWFQYEFSGRCITVYLPPLSDKLKGFLIRGSRDRMEKLNNLISYALFQHQSQLP
ncbi:hypothetical protein Leryth_018931, partial [Lithospermum erythrorhizon]